MIWLVLFKDLFQLYSNFIPTLCNLQYDHVVYIVMTDDLKMNIVIA